ncbi:MAG: glucose-1-phosphate adenylyltransferase subunit GlgD [Clostridia bacterium]|nr:glucose-1-phosphate adenylyltransferase subunit GlgD [Clostridia bacterium]
MRASAVAGIVFANTSDSLLNELTAVRSMASMPFGARYRIIDFSLSNFVNAGISNVGIITNANYRSLMDHVGSGVYYDLDRKAGGLRILPPYNTSLAKRFHGNIEALAGSPAFIERSGADYIVLYNGDSIANVDIESCIDFHIEKGADITTVYAYGKSPEKHKHTMILDLDGDTVKSAKFSNDSLDNVNYSIGITVVNKKVLLPLVEEANQEGLTDFNRDIIANKLSELKVFGFKHSGKVFVMDSINSYYNANMALLNKDTRHDLFNLSRPIFTKTRDDMPTRYGTKSNVQNSVVADGCIIDGTVKNSILFRGVKVEKGAVVENSIIMQEALVSENAVVDCVIADKNSSISKGATVKGTKEDIFHIRKLQFV